MSVYLFLWNGLAPGEERDDCGDDGPLFGPFDGIQITYGCHIKMWYEGYANFCDLNLDSEVYYDGKLYGDFDIFSEPRGDMVTTPYEVSKASRPIFKKD